MWSLSDHTLHSYGPRILRIYILPVIINTILKIIVLFNITIIFDIIVIFNITIIFDILSSATHFFRVSLSSRISPLPPHSSLPLFFPSIHPPINHYGSLASGLLNSVHQTNLSCLSDGAFQHQPLRLPVARPPPTTLLHICFN